MPPSQYGLNAPWLERHADRVDVNRKGTLHLEIRSNILKFWDQLVDDDGAGEVAVALPGPMRDVGAGGRYPSKREILLEMAEAGVEGVSHLKWAELQDRYCGGRRTANFVIPVVSFVPGNERPPLVTSLVILSDPADCARVARQHVKKMPDQGLFLGDGVLSTTDVASWRAQRTHFSDAFLPDASLRRLCPINVARAAKSTAGLVGLAAGGGGGVVNMNEFLLFETMAQLQISLLGMDEGFMDETNVPLRRAFDHATGATGILSGGDSRYLDTPQFERHALYFAGWVQRFLERAAEKRGFDAAGGAPDGPLAARIVESPEPFFNAATMVFAGHDTTANTMSWLLYEVAKRPATQRRLQREADALFARAGAAGIAYEDLGPGLPYLARCLLETLRLWPVVPNGTFRELVTDEEVAGPDGRPVRLPAGTYVQVTNWMRHRAPELWGADAAEWNPDRDFSEEELGFGVPMHGFNPASPRFSPFTYGPRDCMGRNFAQMEMRIILVYLFHSCHFSLAGHAAEPDFGMGVNRGTMGPGDRRRAGEPPSLALEMRVVPRQQKAKL